jgi:hypothetical protein
MKLRDAICRTNGSNNRPTSGGISRILCPGDRGWHQKAIGAAKPRVNKRAKCLAIGNVGRPRFR